jgi:phosphohistidine phosphatase
MDAGTAETGRRLVLLRHAKAAAPEPGRRDADRPLTSRGRADAAAAGAWLVAHVGPPDLVVCSPSVRTRETWSAATGAARALAGCEVRLEPSVYDAWPDTLLDLVRAVPDARSTVVLVGHAPGVPALAERLNRSSGTAPVGDFPTSALAVLAVTGRWADLGPASATLGAYAVPRG